MLQHSPVVNLIPHETLKFPKGISLVENSCSMKNSSSKNRALGPGMQKLYISARPLANNASVILNLFPTERGQRPPRPLSLAAVC